MVQPEPVTHDVLLELASRDYRHGGELERAIAAETGLSVTAFWQHVVRLLDSPPADVAVRWGPTILRLRRQQESRQKQRRR